MVEKIKLPKKAVIDASLVLCLLLPDEKRKSLAEKILRAYQGSKISFLAPSLLKFEVANGLRTAVKRKRINQSLAQRLLGLFLKLRIDYQDVNFIKALNLALKLDLSAYDASYLALSRQLKLHLLSLDQKLSKLS